MPDTFNESGLQVKSLQELTTELEIGLRAVYGADINLDSNSPDGQMVGIVVQSAEDLRELLLNVNAGFDPDQAEGITLDQRVALVGLTRGSGTFTTVEIQVVTSQALALIGLGVQSGEISPTVSGLYIIKDDAGNKWYLMSNQAPGSAGTYSYIFRAAILGAVLVTPSTITTPVTIVGGVVSVNNALGAEEQGIDEESDQDLRVRFRKSTSVIAMGFADSLEAALRNLDGVKSAVVYENNEDTADVFGTPGHTIWCIVEGGASADIAQVIFSKRSGGCGMRGAVTYSIARPNGQAFLAKWDVPASVDIYVHFAISLPGGVVDAAVLAQLIVNNVVWVVGGDAIGSVITAYLSSLDPNYRVSGMGISDDDVTYVENLLSTSPNNRFVMDITRFVIS